MSRHDVGRPPEATSEPAGNALLRRAAVTTRAYWRDNNRSRDAVALALEAAATEDPRAIRDALLAVAFIATDNYEARR